jgi:glycosyltransferase involved in cell wall biosynthesis
MINTQHKVDNTHATEFSVLMSIYHGDIPQQLDTAISSIVNQTLLPSEIVLVKDGPLYDRLDAVIEKWERSNPSLFVIVPLEKNVGLGPALNAGLDKCSYDIVARMDADDISVSNRFEEQLSFLTAHPDIDVVSCFMQVFDRDPNKILFEQHELTTHEEISRIAKFRSPIAHGTVMYRRSAVVSAGGYGDWRGVEDYHLWVRMLRNGSRMASIPKVLYKNRRSTNLGKRRRGFSRVIMQLSLQREFLRLGFISFPRFSCNVILRTIISILPYRIIQYARFKFGLDNKAE